MLNTITWEWTKVTIQNSDYAPSVRAAPCIVPFDDTCAILYGGARALESGGGLEPLDDVWALYVDINNGEGRWEMISPEISVPPGRNAATLSEIALTSSDKSCESKHFLLHGGWAPFRQTFMDDFILRVSAPSTA